MKLLPILSSALVLTGALATTASAQPVPADVQVPAGNVAFESGHAYGVQSYACNGTAWTFVGPNAVLVNRIGLPFIRHFAGPTWQHLDGSSVVGQVEKSVSVDAGSIPWLRLAKKDATPGRFGNRLTQTTYIQRLNTRGGLAPSAPCTAALTGVQRDVPYTADYVFWRKAA